MRALQVAALEIAKTLLAQMRSTDMRQQCLLMGELRT
jgi:hypothetical protein